MMQSHTPAEDTEKIIARTTTYDKELVRELIASDRRVASSPMSPNEVTVAVNGYGSSTFNITNDGSDYVIIHQPGNGNAGRTIICIIGELNGKTVPLFRSEVIDNSRVAENFNQYANLASVTVTQIAGFKTTTTYVTGIITGTTVNDLNNVMHWNREGLRTCSLYPKDYISGALQDTFGIANIMGPEGLQPIRIQQNGSSSANQQPSLVSRFSGVPTTDNFVLGYRLDDGTPSNGLNKYVIPYYLFGAGIEITIDLLFGTATGYAFPTEASLITIHVVGNADGTSRLIFQTSAIENVYAVDTGVMITQTIAVFPPVEAPAAMLASCEIRVRFPTDAGVTGRIVSGSTVGTVTGADKLGGFSRYATVTLLQEMPAGTTISVETFRDYLGVPTSTTTPLLQSVNATRSGQAGYFNPFDALAFANYIFNCSPTSMRVMELSKYRECLENIHDVASDAYISEMAGHIGKFIKGVTRKVIKPAYKIGKGAAKKAWHEIRTNPVGAIEKGMEFANDVERIASLFAGSPPKRIRIETDDGNVGEH